MKLYDDFLYPVVDMMVNQRTKFSDYAEFTKDSDQVIGVDHTDSHGTIIHTKFITDAILKVGQYIKYNNDDSVYYAQIQSIDTETSLTLTAVYQGNGGTGIGYQSETKIPVIIDAKNNPVPSILYIVIKEPAIIDMSEGQAINDGLADETTGIQRSWLYRKATIQVEEIKGNGDVLKRIERSLYTPEVKRFCRALYCAVQKCQDIKNASEMLGMLFEYRNIMDISVEYPDIFEYKTGGIKDVSFTGKYDEEE